MYFNVVPKDDVPCSVLLNNNIKSRITDDSWIDLSKTRHFSLLPNLSYFVGASFPFSRLADYSQTTLLLPADPSETQVATLLNLAARSGNATGTALANNRVVLGMPTGGDLQSLRERDVLAVTALDQQAFNQSLLADSPYRPVDNVLSVREPDLWQKSSAGSPATGLRQPRRRSLLFVEQRLARVHQLSLAVEFHPPGGGGAGQQ